jgi:hypothetical protein
MAILRIREAATLVNPRVINFLMEAAKENSFEDAESVLSYVATQVQYDGCGLWLGAEELELKAVTLAFWPANPLMLAPQVVVAYNIGSPALAKELANVVIDWVREGGYDRILGINRTGKPGEVHMRAYRAFGEPTMLGEQIEYRLRPQQQEEVPWQALPAVEALNTATNQLPPL